MNNSNPVKIWLIIGLTSWLTACGGGGGGGGGTSTPAGPVPVALKSIDGIWSTGCLVDGSASAMLIITFDMGTATLVFTEYMDVSCSPGVLTMSETTTATYVLRNAVTVDGSVAGITSATQADLTNTTVGSMDLGVISYSLVAIKDNKFYTGDGSGANDGDTEDLRHTQLDSEFVLDKI